MREQADTSAGGSAASVLRHWTAIALAALPMLAGSDAWAQASPSPYTFGTRYDPLGRVTGTIAPDPDAAGPLAFPAVRNSYDAAGRLSRVEMGELASWHSEAVAPANWTGFTVHQTVERAYDAAGRKERETLRGGTAGAIQTLTQYSYDPAGRLECTAIRMNPAAFGALPGSACSLGSQGTQGPDRIARLVHDAAGQVLHEQRGYGTALQQNDASYTYSSNGKRLSVTDANGNRAELRYDGHDRQVRWVFPHPTLAGVVNDGDNGDYEAYGYDAAGNRTSLRRRDGSTLTFQYDAMNRMVVKVVPERTGLSSTHTRDVHYGYDLRGLQTFARFDSPTGEGVTNSYDGFGRLDTSAIAMDGFSRTISYDYDAAGHRSFMTAGWDYNLTFAYDAAGRMTAIRENGPNTIALFGYDARGRRSSLQLGSGGVFASAGSYGYDAVGRLSSLGRDLAGSASDQSLGFAYNPASQVISRTTSNNAYASNTAYDINRGYSANGLNQYTAAGAATFGYDANGNLTSDGSTTFTYDVENRLVAAGGARSAALRYDPLGRLYEISGNAGTTRFFYDGDRLIEEYDGAWNRLRVYAHGPETDEPLVLYDGALGYARRFLHADHLGSIIAAADESGNAVAINGYDAWGIPNAGNIGRFQYTGQTWLPELGLYYYKARIYSPTLGRFLQTDPIGYEDQINLYAYVGNDPMNIVDPSGKCGDIQDQSTRADCYRQRAAALEQAKAHLATQSVRSGSDEAGYIATYNDETREVTVRTGDDAGERDNGEVRFTDQEGRPLRARPGGRIVERVNGVNRDTREVVLVTGHSHPKENEGGGRISARLDIANESIGNNPGDQALSRIGPAVIRTPSGRIRVFVNGREVR